MAEEMVAMSSSTAEVLRRGVRGRRHSELESLALNSSLLICGGDGTLRIEVMPTSESRDCHVEIQIGVI